MPGDRLQSESNKGDVLVPGNALREKRDGWRPHEYQHLILNYGYSFQCRENGLKNNFSRSGDAVATRKRALRQR